MNDIPEEGMKVHVFSADKKKDLGLGTIEKVEPLQIEEPGLTITSSYPSRIVLDSGEMTNGFNCWWISIEREKAVKAELTSKQWIRILKNQGYRCNICQRKFTKNQSATVDHIIPVSKRGDLSSLNVQALCISCNSRKGAKVLKSFIVSW